MTMLSILCVHPAIQQCQWPYDQLAVAKHGAMTGAKVRDVNFSLAFIPNLTKLGPSDTGLFSC